MKKSILIVPSTICFFLMAGCVSTTTGSITEPERNNKEAADIDIGGTIADKAHGVGTNVGLAYIVTPYDENIRLFSLGLRSKYYR